MMYIILSQDSTIQVFASPAKDVQEGTQGGSVGPLILGLRISPWKNALENYLGP